MVTHYMLRTLKGKYPICDCSRANQKPYTGRITEIVPYVRIDELPTHINTMQSSILIFCPGFTRTFAIYSKLPCLIYNYYGHQ